MKVEEAPSSTLSYRNSSSDEALAFKMKSCENELKSLTTLRIKTLESIITEKVERIDQLE